MQQLEDTELKCRWLTKIELTLLNVIFEWDIFYHICEAYVFPHPVNRTMLLYYTIPSCLGDSYSYCANPTNAKTDWCPTQLNDDGTYTSNLGFAWCEADTYTACEEAKAANPVTCPCASEWIFKVEMNESS